MKERRKNKRYPAVYKVTYSTAENPEKQIEVDSFNLSRTGICIHIQEFFEGSGKVRILIYRAYNPKPIKIWGKIIWQSGIAMRGADRAGIQFIKPAKIDF